ncbi:MAG TPA: transcription antitermination factor NusB, partial [Candidatus Limisoma intestinavium]|nr:transcription antitermination factor NusB [Candidatus Limisoma intestinavium]
MINRILIRIKVVQMLYAYLLSKSDMRMQDALKELRKSLDKAYELYHYLLLLPVELTRLQELRIDNARNKYLPTPEDLNPNMKFVENRFVAKMRQSEMMQEFLKTTPLSWRKNDIYLRLTLDKILNSDIYKAYMETPQSDLASDCELWKDLMKKVIFPDDELCDVLEEESVYWNDDLETIGTFVLKTIRRFADDGYDKLLPQFK